MAYLVLEDGSVYTGELFGAKKDTIGEAVFNTGMTGYQEVLTDPSYAGQLVMMTYPLIGNYGFNLKDMESAGIGASGFIVSSLCERPSNWMAEGSLNCFLKERGVTGIMGVDTRALTKHLRSIGVMRGIICSQMPTDSQMNELKQYIISRPVLKMTCSEKYSLGEGTRKIAVLDFGAKQNIIRSLASLGNALTVYPALTSAEEILQDGCDGVMLTNGPGDPKDNMDIAQNILKLMDRKPVFGICLGHQLMALAKGGDTEKLKYGHRGGNHPVKDLKQDRVYITSQNHGYSVIADSIKGFAQVSHVNWNDGTVEGVAYKNIPSFSVQYHPEAAPGPQDSFGLFKQFIQMIDSNK